MNKLIDKIRSLFCRDVYIDIQLQNKYDKLKEENASLNDKYNKLYSEYQTLYLAYKGDARKQYWDTKRVALNEFTYKAREGTHIDPRIYYTKDSTIPKQKGIDNDDLAMNCLNWVWKNIKYTPDRDQYGRPKEQWNFAYETLRNKFGDCEDGAILLANMMIVSGIPSWRIRINVGSVEGDYHAWVTYLNNGGEWVVLDWCYYATESIAGLLWKDAERYFYIDFSFNEEFIYINNIKLDRS